MNLQTMDAEARYYQFTLENQVLDHVKTALRKTLSADEDRLGFARKVSSVRFVTESLHRHLIRMLDLEESDPLLDPAEDVKPQETKPHLAERALKLQQEHIVMRASLDQIGKMCELLSAQNEAMFEDFSQQVTEFLDLVDHHELAEQQLIQEIYNFDEGGEGGEG